MHNYMCTNTVWHLFLICNRMSNNINHKLSSLHRSIITQIIYFLLRSIITIEFLQLFIKKTKYSNQCMYACMHACMDVCMYVSVELPILRYFRRVQSHRSQGIFTQLNIPQKKSPEPWLSVEQLQSLHSSLEVHIHNHYESWN